VVYLAQVISQQMTGDDLPLLFGLKYNESIRAGQVWRFITPIFLHIGILHIFVNMYSLNVLGPVIERLFGSARMLVIYLLSGISGVVFSLAFSPYPSAGASGAIFGLLGAFGVFLFHHRKTFGQAAKDQLRQVAFIAILNLGLGLLPQIDNWGHLGGLLSGMALTWIIGPKYEVTWVFEDRRALQDRRPWNQVWPFSLLALLAIFLLAYLAMISPFTQ
jgi:rhomboid protease GluP